MNKKKELRQRVWFKYDRHCAYCGKVLEYKDMQVDHMISKYEVETYRNPEIAYSELNSFGNLMPSCRRCNHYKRDAGLERFRELMETLHKRITGQYTIKVAIDYGIINGIKPFDGIFYFEKGRKRKTEYDK